MKLNCPVIATVLILILHFLQLPGFAIQEGSSGEPDSTQQDAAGEPYYDEHEADREQLLELKAVVEEAMSNDDRIHILREHVADDFSVVTFTSREFNDFDVFVEEWNKSREKFLNGGTFTVNIVPEPAVFDGDIAICFGNSDNVMVTGSGGEFKFESPWSATCRKVDGQWKLVRAHSSIDPFDNPVLNANIKKYLWIVGVACVVAGLLIGRMLTRWNTAGPVDKPSE
ncbi:MAG: hypothetical protein AAF456_14060 [Planctomycetota bacterium]